MDLLHILLFFESKWIIRVLQVVEELGELFSITALCAVSAVAARHPRRLLPLD